MLAMKATGVISSRVMAAVARTSLKDCHASCLVQPGMSTKLPTTRATKYIHMEVTKTHAEMINNFAVTITSRDVGNAIKSLAVWSENSRPKIQAVTMENTMTPPIAMA